ncbi:MAG: RNA polymerase sigma factor [Anaerolineales bacterium]|nr:RNA polymerase sigma factor [Anaerolineales bacterium]
MTDPSALLKAARRLDKGALAEIFDLHAPDIYNYILRLCQDPIQADQVVGDVFSRFLDQLAAGQGPHTNLRAYLYQTAYHLFIDQAREVQRFAPIEIVEFFAPDNYSIQDAVENRALLDAVMLAINNDLTEEQRHVIVLRFLEGLSLKETAQIVGKNENSVKVLQGRGIAKLRKVLSDLRSDSKGYQ